MMHLKNNKCHLGCIDRSAGSGSREVTLPLFSVVQMALWKVASNLGHPLLGRRVSELVHLQRRAAKMTRDLEGKPVKNS